MRSDHTSTNWWRYIDLTWCPSDATEGVTGYRVYRSQKSRGPYTLMNSNQDVSPLCIDGKHRCEITSPSAGVFEVSSPVSSPGGCTTGKFSTCRLVDTTVDVTPSDTNYPNQVQNYVYYYVVTAVKRDGGGTIVHESAYSVENQGWPNYCSGTLYNCNRHDPDILPSVTCGLPQSAALEPNEPGAAVAETTGVSFTQKDLVAPYRTIGVGEPEEGPQPSGPPPTPNAVAKWIYFHLDHLGSPRVLTNATGLLVSTHRYMPFGDERPVQAQGSTTTRQFTGHERDKESGLDYMVGRYYGTSLGRFLSPDPFTPMEFEGNPEIFQKVLQDPAAWNRYTYVSNNPLRYVDPSGMKKESPWWYPLEILGRILRAIGRVPDAPVEGAIVLVDTQLPHQINALVNETTMAAAGSSDPELIDIANDAIELRMDWSEAEVKGDREKMSEVRARYHKLKERWEKKKANMEQSNDQKDKSKRIRRDRFPIDPVRPSGPITPDSVGP